MYDANGDQEVGKISKQWSGFVQEYFTDADNFGVNCKYAISAHKTIGIGLSLDRNHRAFRTAVPIRPPPFVRAAVNFDS